MNKKAGFTLVDLTILILGVAGVGGWIANIVKLTGMSLDPLTGLLVVRAIGVFIPPVGAIVGYF